MNIRLTIELDVPASANGSKRDGLRQFSDAVRARSWPILGHELPGEIVFMSTEVIDAGETIMNNRKRI